MPDHLSYTISGKRLIIEPGKKVFQGDEPLNPIVEISNDGMADGWGRVELLCLNNDMVQVESQVRVKIGKGSTVKTYRTTVLLNRKSLEMAIDLLNAEGLKKAG